MKRIKLNKTDFVGLGPNGHVLFYNDILKMRVGEEYTNITTYGELALRATGCCATRLFLQLEERYYDNDGVLQNTAVVEKYEIERG